VANTKETDLLSRKVSLEGPAGKVKSCELDTEKKSENSLRKNCQRLIKQASQKRIARGEEFSKNTWSLFDKKSLRENLIGRKTAR